MVSGLFALFFRRWEEVYIKDVRKLREQYGVFVFVPGGLLPDLSLDNPTMRDAPGIPGLLKTTAVSSTETG